MATLRHDALPTSAMTHITTDRTSNPYKTVPNTAGRFEETVSPTNGRPREIIFADTHVDDTEIRSGKRG